MYNAVRRTWFAVGMAALACSCGSEATSESSRDATDASPRDASSGDVESTPESGVEAGVDATSDVLPDSLLADTGTDATGHCSDDVQNDDETDVDCGGASCPPCGASAHCGTSSDCESGVCGSGICIASSCSDGVHNGKETDVDCGGDCGPCEDGSACALPWDCESQVCQSKVCQTPTCDDGVENGLELAIDCGGGECGPCGVGLPCNDATDCVSGACQAGVCQPPMCADEIRNGTETDVDCGGEACPPCVNGAGCVDGQDCVSGLCVSSTCLAPSCIDGMQNNDETGIDCGGPECSLCPSGQGCVSANDCLSKVCSAGVCAVADCSDGVRNGQESDVDCGGACSPCGDGADCDNADDCVSLVCVGGSCATPSCSDGVANGDEHEVDCGGSCPGCSTGTPCVQADDCLSLRCVAHLCAEPTCVDGVRNGSETDVDCGGSCPALCANGAQCATDNDCSAGHCEQGHCTATSCQGGIGLPTRSEFSIGGPLSFAVGDLDNNGMVDIVLPGIGNEVGVRFNSGSGFTPREMYTFLPTPQHASIGDLDGDGFADIVIGTADGKVSVARNDGSGAFNHVLDLTVGSSDVTSVVVDFDGDGDRDIVAADCKDGTILLIPNIDGVSFGPETVLDGGECPTNVRSGDLNGDGMPDLAVANYSVYSSAENRVSVFLSHGDGTFDAPIRYEALLETIDVSIADFDGDGLNDLASVSYGAARMYKNLGAGLLDEPVYRNVCGRSLAAGDFNGDALPDLVTGHEYNMTPAFGHADVLINAGDGTFNEPKSLGLGAQGVSTVAVADIDEDGSLDFPLADTAGIGVHFGNGDGTFSERMYLDFNNTDLRSAAAGDIDGDGLVDLLVGGQVGFSNGAISVVYARDGKLGDLWTSALSLTPTDIVVSDFNVDGLLDFAVSAELLATSGYATGRVFVFMNQGGNNYWVLEYSTGMNANDIALGDVNLDGLPDLVAVNGYSKSVYVLTNGGSTFPKKDVYPFAYTIDFLGDVAVGDLNGDGYPDIALDSPVYGVPTRIQLLWNDGTGAFGIGPVLEAVSEPYSLAVQDIDQDGDADVVSAGRNAVSVHLSLGDGTFLEPVAYPSDVTYGEMTLADVDGDGEADIVLTDGAQGLVKIFTNTGSGTFGSYVSYPCGANPSAVAAGDFDGDGRVDVATVSHGHGRVTVLSGGCL